MYRVLFVITRFYFYLRKPMRRLERFANGMRITAVFHRKYGKGSQCMIKDCSCKRSLALNR